MHRPEDEMHTGCSAAQQGGEIKRFTTGRKQEHLLIGLVTKLLECGKHSNMNGQGAEPSFRRGMGEAKVLFLRRRARGHEDHPGERLIVAGCLWECDLAGAPRACDRAVSCFPGST